MVSKRIKKLVWIFFPVVIILVSFFIYQEIYNQRVYLGVSIGRINLAGKTFEETVELLEQEVNYIDRQGLIFIGQSVDKEKKKEISISPTLIALSDPDLSRQILSFDIETVALKALAFGRQGSLFKQFKERISGLFIPYQASMAFQIDEEEFKKILKQNFSCLENPAQDARLAVDKNHQFYLVEESLGLVFDYDLAIETAKENLRKLSRQPVELTLKVDLPQIEVKDSQTCFKEAEELRFLAPLTFKFEDQIWSVDQDLVENWLQLKLEDGAVKVGVNQEEASLFLKTIAEKIDIPAVDAKFEIAESRVIEFQTSADGRALNFGKTLENITQQFVKSKKKEIVLAVDQLYPQRLTQDVNQLGIKELIGRGQSNFAGSPQNRRHNITQGSAMLHGILIEPKEEFSLVKALGEVGPETGYKPELVIKGDETIPEYGGGLCQIATTAFRVALDAGLPITARTPHSYRVSYYEPAGMDATIYRPQPDVKFINDTPAHILFQTKIEGNNLIFEFYGTSDGRTVEITKPQFFNFVKPGQAKYIETNELPPGEKKRIEYPHTGADTAFTRTITYPDGQVKEEEWRSHYKPWQEIWLVGKKVEESEKLDELTGEKK